jgi:L-seryl-tRNA(Ser) seleniumtransferase
MTKEKENLQKALSSLPKVDKVLEHDKVRVLLDRVDKPLLKRVVNGLLNEKREALKKAFKNKEPVEKVTISNFIKLLAERVEGLLSDKLVKVVNASGTVLHTNLGRAPIDGKALKRAVDVSAGYSNLEFDLEGGKRGSRYSHFEELIRLVTGAEAALAVNNNAAAVLLVLNTFAEGKEAVVSRGELIEIGGAFRIPEVMKKSQTVLREVGTTNKTHLKDYEKAVTKSTGLLLKVHTSNYKIVGFTKEVELSELVTLGKKKRVVVYNDLGSGCLIDLSDYGVEKEVTVNEVIRSGVDIVSFSGDKLFGGPQAGIIVGKKKYIDKIKKNPLTRALRLDKMTIAALYQTFKAYLNSKDALKSIPALKMLTAKKTGIRKRCDTFLDRLKGLKKRSVRLSVKDDFSYVGGGALPLSKLETCVIALKSEKVSAARIAKRFREYATPVIVRVSNDKVLFDLRTVLKGEEKIILDAFNEIF